jgi:eukaryotic-like serine/threonine-protein kinase
MGERHAALMNAATLVERGMPDETHLYYERARRRVGTSLRRGKYALDALLGIGAMGAVYSATHRNGMRVAIKVLHPELARVDDLRSRFLREGYIANMVHHPGLVRVLDDDIDDDGSTFLVMELLDGLTLSAEWVASGHVLPLARVAAIVDALLDVLDAIHAAGIVHRDVKPDNVFLVRGGPLKVLDLGVARILIESRLTASGQIVGTPEFIAPEQARGDVRAITARADIYSVGAMMFVLLTAQPVHEARSPMEAMIFGATRPARSLTQVWPAAPPLLVRVVDVALAFEQERRWANATEMRAALASAMRQIPSISPTRSSAPPAQVATGTLLGSGPTSEPEKPFPLARPGARKG